jgi:hypothetical protein
VLVATVVALSARAADDVLELFDTLMTTELLSKAERESANEKLRRYPRVSCNAGKLAAAVKLLLALDLDAGLAAVWELIENEVPKHELRAAVAAIDELGPPTDAELDGQRMEELAGRLATVRPFLPLLMETVEFGATGDGVAVLAAMRTLATLLTVKSKLPASYLDARQVNHDLITGGWQRLVYAPGRPAGTVDRAAVRGLPAGAVPPAHQASQHLRHRVVSLARPARSSAVRRGVGDRPRAGDERARPARAAGADARRPRRAAGCRLPRGGVPAGRGHPGHRGRRGPAARGRAVRGARSGVVGRPAPAGGSDAASVRSARAGAGGDVLAPAIRRGVHPHLRQRGPRRRPRPVGRRGAVRARDERRVRPGHHAQRRGPHP